MASKFEYYSTGDNAETGAYDANWWAQTFTPSIAHTVTSVKLKLYRLGSPGTVIVSIKATSEGKPTGSDLTSGTTNGDTLTDSSAGEWREITLSNYALSASTQYAIVIRALTGDIDNYVGLRYDTTGTYTGGNGALSVDSGSFWTTYSDFDFMFEDWGDTAVYLATLTAAIGLSPTLSRATAYARSLTTAVGLVASIGDIERNLASWLCVASRDGGSVKTRTGSSWSSCAKDSNGDLAGAYFAQFDNRLCVISYQNTGFAYSPVNDITANWTDKPNFPILPEISSCSQLSSVDPKTKLENTSR